MAAFVITLIISLIIFIACIFWTVMLFKRNKKYKKEDKKIKENGKIISISRKRKRDNYLLLMSFGGIVISFIGILYTLYNSVPAPAISPIDNEAKVYSGTTKVTIDAVNLPFFHTYYSLDGSDPQNGNIYEVPLTITKTTTVSAKNKFFFWWSGLSQRTYRFENMQITYSGYANALIEDGHRVIDGFLGLIIKGILVFAFLVALFRSLFNRGND